MDQPPTPNHSDFVKPAANGPTPAAVVPDNGAAPANDEAAPAPAVPLTPVAWLSQNAVYIVGFAAIVGALQYYKGFEGVVKAAEVALGLSFVIFVHELGHFLAARWCDVHVQTFSLGFGPAIPGCSFRRGETLYKIAILPLGGYVAMVGEGTETDEGEDYPRSFKNKTVGQRMLIITAGVVMNMILGFVCFIGVFYLHGDERPKGAVGNVEPASPAWKNGVRGGSKIMSIGSKQDPNFRDLQLRVASTWFNSKIPFEFQPRPGEGPLLAVELEPRRDENDDQPVIGVSSSLKLQLPPAEQEKFRGKPVHSGSSAAQGRVIDLARGAADLKDSDGFHFGDTIVGTTDDSQTENNYDPLVVKLLPLNPNDDPQVNPDPFVFSKRMKVLAGKPVVIQVRREGQPADAPPVNILVPPSFTPTTGLVMEMGLVAGVRNNSPAARAGVQEGDTIIRIELLATGGHSDVPLADFTESDPARLPFDLEQAVKRAAATPGKKMARLTVLRPKQIGQATNGEDGHRGSNRLTLDPVEWDANWDSSAELPMKASSPLSIPQLGVAYWINCIVKEVKHGSAAEQAGIQVGDQVVEIRMRTAGKNEDEEKAKEKKDWTWTNWVKLESKRDGRVEPDEWAFCSQLRGAFDRPTFQMKVARGGKILQEDGKDKLFDVETKYDTTWPSDDIGLSFVSDLTNVKAKSVWDAVGLGLNETWDLVQHIYLGMRNLVTGRVNPVKSFGGPIAIATTAFSAADDPYKLVLFMGIISINLAIVNFLPIPLLDGGHMLLLTYEKIRGKPPSENWRMVLTYLGIVVLLLMMLTAFSLDIAKWLNWL